MLTLALWAALPIDAEGWALLNVAIPDSEWEPRFDAWEAAKQAVRDFSEGCA